MQGVVQQNVVREQTGATFGVFVCAIFGTVWTFLAIVFSGHAQALAFAVAAVPGIALLTLAIRRLRILRRFTGPADNVGRAFTIMKVSGGIVVIEWVLGGVGVFLLIRLRRYDLIPQVLGFIIGLHFVPLARIFRVPLYYWTGSLMVLISGLSLLVTRGHMRNIVACGGLGFILWMTGVAMLRRASLAVAA